MKQRTVKQVVKAMPAVMGKDTIYQPFPSHALEHVDPFILLHHWGPYTYNPGNDAFSVEAHPHRGFEPVTFIFQGEVHHRDSMGNDSIIKEGGVQWMTAGKGVMHSEMGTEEFHKKGGNFEIIQVWMNLPKALKMTTPAYYGVQKNEIPIVEQDNGKVIIKVASGTFGGATGPITSITGIESSMIEMKKDGKAEIEIGENKNVMLYLLDGSIKVNGREVLSGRNVVTFGNEGTRINIEAGASSKILLLAGTPINEPVAQYGPFVMNTREELNQAFDDFYNGKMGKLN